VPCNRPSVDLRLTLNVAHVLISRLLYCMADMCLSVILNVLLILTINQNFSNHLVPDVHRPTVGLAECKVPSFITSDKVYYHAAFSQQILRSPQMKLL
jgi:hypothetical protein